MPGAIRGRSKPRVAQRENRALKVALKADLDARFRNENLAVDFPREQDIAPAAREISARNRNRGPIAASVLEQVVVLDSRGHGGTTRMTGKTQPRFEVFGNSQGMKEPPRIRPDAEFHVDGRSMGLRRIGEAPGDAAGG